MYKREQYSEAFIGLLLEHEKELLRFIFQLAGNREDAKDIMQKTAIALWKKFESCDSSKPFVVWARQFARYEALSHHRNSGRCISFSPELIQSLIDSQESYEEQSNLREKALQHCLQKLPEKDRHLITVRYFEKKNIQKSASEIGRSADAIYQALKRIRKQLYDCINKSLQEQVS